MFVALFVFGQGFPLTNPTSLPNGSFVQVQQIGGNSTGVAIDSFIGDNTIINEGALSVGAATTSTSQIASNTSGDGGVIIKVGSTDILSESVDTIAFALSTGIYSPSITEVTNIDTVIVYETQYLRIGNMVTVSGKIGLDATITGATEAAISVPIASDFSAEEQAGGTAASEVALATPVRIKADATNNRLSFVFTAATTTLDNYSFTVTYRIQ